MRIQCITCREKGTMLDNLDRVEARLFVLAHFLVHLGDFFWACLPLLFCCYRLLCVLTVLNVVCIYVELLLLSLHAFGFCFWSIFFYYFCFIQCSFIFLLILCGVINKAL